MPGKQPTLCADHLPDEWPIAWGDQADIRFISLSGESVSDAMVSGYLAKYATEGTEITGHTSRRLHDHNIRLHTERFVDAAWTPRSQGPRSSVTIAPRCCR